MTILDQTPTRLIIRTGPKIVQFFIALAMLAFMCVFAFAQHSTGLTCRRVPDGTGECTMTEYRLIGNSRQSYNLRAIQSAQVQSRAGSYRGNPTTSYVLVLQVSNSTVTVSDKDSKTEQYQAASRINSFLTDPNQQTLEMPPASDSVFLVFGLVFVVSVAWYGGTALEVATFTFDKEENSLIIQQRRLVTHTAHYALTDIDDLWLEVQPASRQSPAVKTVYLMLSSGKQVATLLPPNLMATIRPYLKPSKPAASTAQTAHTQRPAKHFKYRRVKHTASDEPPTT